MMRALAVIGKLDRGAPTADSTTSGNRRGSHSAGACASLVRQPLEALPPSQASPRLRRAMQWPTDASRTKPVTARPCLDELTDMQTAPSLCSPVRNAASAGRSPPRDRASYSCLGADTRSAPPSLAVSGDRDDLAVLCLIEVRRASMSVLCFVRTDRLHVFRLVVPTSAEYHCLVDTLSARPPGMTASLVPSGSRRSRLLVAPRDRSLHRT